MKPSVYLETSIIGCLAMRPASDLRIAANQQTSHDFWDNQRDNYNLCISRFVMDECLRGDPTAAQERLVYLEGIPLLEVNELAGELAESLLKDVPLPAKATIDAYHISVAAVNGVNFLLTWNCRHIANPALRPRIEAACRKLNCEPPVICTPQELLEVNDAF